jgi:hypothetical protein
MGKPVVAPSVEEAGSISSLVYLARDEEAYFSAIERALNEDLAQGMPRIQYASQFAFDKTMQAIAGPVRQFLQVADRPGNSSP